MSNTGKNPFIQICIFICIDSLLTASFCEVMGSCYLGVFNICSLMYSIPPIIPLWISILLLAFWSMWHPLPLLHLLPPLQVHRDNKAPVPTSLVQTEDGATWSLGTDIKESRGGCYLELQCQTPAAAVLVISPSTSLPPPLLILPSSTLVTELSAARSTEDRWTSLGSGGMEGMDERKRDGRKEGRKRKQYLKVWVRVVSGSKQQRRSFSTNSNPVNVFFLLLPHSEYREKPAAERLRSLNLTAVRQRQIKETERGENGSVTASAATLCFTRKPDRVRVMWRAALGMWGCRKKIVQ